MIINTDELKYPLIIIKSSRCILNEDCKEQFINEVQNEYQRGIEKGIMCFNANLSISIVDKDGNVKQVC